MLWNIAISPVTTSPTSPWRLSLQSTLGLSVAPIHLWYFYGVYCTDKSLLEVLSSNNLLSLWTWGRAGQSNFTQQRKVHFLPSLVCSISFINFIYVSFPRFLKNKPIWRGFPSLPSTLLPCFFFGTEISVFSFSFYKLVMSHNKDNSTEYDHWAIEPWLLIHWTLVEIWRKKELMECVLNKINYK